MSAFYKPIESGDKMDIFELKQNARLLKAISTVRPIVLDLVKNDNDDTEAMNCLKLLDSLDDITTDSILMDIEDIK